MKKLTILGSTGSIGRQTLDVIRKLGGYEIGGLAADRNVRELEAQVREFRPPVVCIYDEAAAAELRLRLADLDTRVLSGPEGLVRLAAEEPADMVSVSVMGMIGLKATMAAIRAGRDLAIANKETLVTAGHLIMPLVRECGTRLLPVDSEHSAIFQCLQGESPEAVHKLLITCSGGPFRGRTLSQMKNITPEEALKHPNWSMGAKITIDSSTLVNKGLEVMEAHWLYDVPYDRIQVVVHPQSVIHSMVEFVDGSVKAQLGVPDMRLPIQYALFYPERRPATEERLDFTKLSQLTFETPDLTNFPGLRLAYEAGEMGGSMTTVFNAANEWAVARFLRKEIGYLDIYRSIDRAMNGHEWIAEPGLEDILETERWVSGYLSTAR